MISLKKSLHNSLILGGGSGHVWTLDLPRLGPAEDHGIYQLSQALLICVLVPWAFASLCHPDTLRILVQNMGYLF